MAYWGWSRFYTEPPGQAMWHLVTVIEHPALAANGRYHLACDDSPIDAFGVESAATDPPSGQLTCLECRRKTETG